MATEQDIRLSRRSGFSARTAFKNIVLLIPAVAIIAATLNTLSCGSPGLLTPVSSSTSPTATPTSTAGTLAYVTNYNDGKVSSFTRNTTTGALKHTGQVTAGKKKGPRGVVASGHFLYVANINDDNIYEYSIASTKGIPTALPTPSISNGSGTKPDELAINSAGTLLWVTGAAGTVTSYTVNTTTGQLTLVGSIAGGFTTPFGITLHPTLAVLYVSDTVTGSIWPMSYNPSTGALTKNFTAVHSSDVNANTPAAIAIDSAGDALFIADQVLGEVSSFSINTTTGALSPVAVFANSNVNDVPIGLGIAINAGVEYLFTANQGISGGLAGSLSSFQQITNPTNLVTPPTVAGPYNGPTGLVVDSANLFVYTADNFDGTVSQSIIKGSCGSSICAGPKVSTESPANVNSGPFGITLAQ
jgi:6-phosphogluconolactonase (cycloisomerase 2 family)